MAKLSNFKLLKKDDFDQDQHDFIDKVAYVINPFLEQISNAFNKNITIDNLSREISSIDVENATGGTLKIPVDLKTRLTGRIVGIHVIKSDNLTNTAVYPTNTVGVSWTLNGTIINIKNVTGIQDNNKYRLTLELIS